MQVDDTLILARERAAENHPPRGTQAHDETALAGELVLVSHQLRRDTHLGRKSALPWQRRAPHAWTAAELT